MSQFTISPIIVNNEAAFYIQISEVNYNCNGGSLEVYYRYLNYNGIAIPTGEGNITIGTGVITSGQDTALRNAVLGFDAAATNIVLAFHQFLSSTYTFNWVSSGVNKTRKFTGTYISAVTELSIRDTVFTDLGLESTGQDRVTDDYADISGSSSGERGFLQTAVSSMVEGGVYDLWVALYPFTGSDFAHKFYNLIDPSELLGSFKISQIGSPSDNADGVTLNSASDILNSNCELDLISNQDYIGALWYVQNSVVKPIFFGIDGSGTPVGAVFTVEPRNAGKFYGSIWAGSSGVSVPTNPPAGLSLVQRTNTANKQIKYYRGATLTTQETLAVNNDISYLTTLGMFGNSDGAITVSCWGIMKAATSSQIITINSIISQLMADFGRTAP